MPVVPGDEPPNWEEPVPLKEVGPSAVPFGLPLFIECFGIVLAEL